MKVLQLNEVTKTYGKDRAQVHAVNKVSLDIERGSFTSIIGRSGSGKSTLLKICAGLLKPEKGSVILDGDDLTKIKDKNRCTIRRRKVGFVFQNFELIPEFNLMENVCVPFYLDDRSPDMEYIDELLKVTYLYDKKDRFPEELSGGEQQCMAIVRALATRPAIIFADEPTGNLDMRTGEEIMELLNYCNVRYQQTILMVTHNLELLQSAYRILKMQDGRIVEDYDKGIENL